MASEMTTFKGQPFDRASLDSVMKVCAQESYVVCVCVCSGY